MSIRLDSKGCIGIRFFQNQRIRCNRICLSLQTDDEDVYVSQFCSNHYQLTRPFYRAYKFVTDCALNTYNETIKEQGGQEQDRSIDHEQIKKKLRFIYARLTRAILKRSKFMQNFVIPECHDPGHVGFIKTLKDAQQDCHDRLSAVISEEQCVPEKPTNIKDERQQEDQEEVDAEEHQKDDQKNQSNSNRKVKKRNASRRRQRQRASLKKYIDALVAQAEEEHAEIRTVFTTCFDSLKDLCSDLFRANVLPLIAETFRKEMQDEWDLGEWSDTAVDESGNRVIVRLIKQPHRSSTDDQIRCILLLSDNCVGDIYLASGLGDFSMFWKRLSDLRTLLKQESAHNLSPRFTRFLLDILESCQQCEHSLVSHINPLDVQKYISFGQKDAAQRYDEETKLPLLASSVSHRALNDFREEYIPTLIQALTDSQFTMEEAKWFKEKLMCSEDLTAIWRTKCWKHLVSSQVDKLVCSMFCTGFQKAINHFKLEWSKIVAQTEPTLVDWLGLSTDTFHMKRFTNNSTLCWYALTVDKFIPLLKSNLPSLYTKMTSEQLTIYTNLLHASLYDAEYYESFVPFLVDIDHVISRIKNTVA